MSLEKAILGNFDNYQVCRKISGYHYSSGVRPEKLLAEL
jgi:hypothetical protein